jgi:hypothetical protein
MHRIGKEDVVGARIVDIHQTSESKNDLDFRVFYFTVDRGFTFTLPMPGFPFSSEKVPNTARRVRGRGWFGRMRLARDWVRDIKRHTIAGIIVRRKVDLQFPEAS